MNFIIEGLSGRDPVTPFLLLLVGAAALIGTWIALTRWRNSIFYPMFWMGVDLFLTSWWGYGVINAVLVGSGTPGNGWDAFGAAIILFLSIPAFVWDIVFLLRWPRRYTQNR